MTAAAQDHRRKTRAPQPWRKDDVRKAVEGAIAGGMPVGRIEFSRNGFSLVAQGDSAPSSEAADVERRMQEAFEGDDD